MPQPKAPAPGELASPLSLPAVQALEFRAEGYALGQVFSIGSRTETGRILDVFCHLWGVRV